MKEIIYFSAFSSYIKCFLLNFVFLVEKISSLRFFFLLVESSEIVMHVCPKLMNEM